MPTPARFRSTIASIVLQPEDLARPAHVPSGAGRREPAADRRVGLPMAKRASRELIAHVGLSQPLVSHHLKRLRVAGLVETRRVGRETICTLRPEAFGEVAARERAILGIAS